MYVCTSTKICVYVGTEYGGHLHNEFLAEVAAML